MVLDTSGSMHSQQLGHALGAIASFAVARDVPAARVVFCDAATYDAGYLAPEAIAERVQVKGRGGTVLQPAVDFLEHAADFPKDAPLLVVSDGLCDVLSIHRPHAFLMSEGAFLPFVPRGPVFRMPNPGFKREGRPQSPPALPGYRPTGWHASCRRPTTRMSDQSADPSPEQLEELARRMLAELLRGHGFAAEERDGAVHLLERPLRAECRVGDLRRHPNAVVLRLDVALWTDLEPDHPIVTPLSGFGRDWAAALGKAETDWVHRVFDPIAAALGLRPREHDGRMTATTPATGLTTVWDVYEGDAEVMALGGELEPVQRAIVGGQRPLALVLDALTGLVGAFPDRPLHWAKLFLARNPDGSRTVEFQLDNADWPHDLAKLHAFVWPDQPGLMAVKYFAVLRRTQDA